MRFLSLATLLTVTGLAEDKLTLKSGEVLTGSVETISSENTIGIKHIATDSNLSLDATKALKIDINVEQNESEQRPPSIVVLSNGDSIAGQVKQLTKDTLTLSSEHTGTHQIPKADIENITFGESVHFPIYTQSKESGPFKISQGWKNDKKGNILANKTANMWQEFELTDNFIIKFNLKWQSSPQFMLYFASAKSDVPTDQGGDTCYYLNLGQSKIALGQKFASTDKTVNKRDADNCSKTLRDYPQGNVDIELWVSRLTGKITLFLDGKKVHNSHFLMTPPGNFIGFQCLSSNSTTTLSNIEIATWDGQQTPKALNKPYKGKDDLISLVNGDALTGKILGTSLKNGAIEYILKYEHSVDGNIKQAEDKIRMIRFSKAVAPKVIENKQLHSQIKGNNKLSLSKIRMHGDLVTAEHPILGEIQIQKKNLTTLRFN